MVRNPILSGSLAALIALSSCATSTTGIRETITVNSSPAGADARLLCGGQTAGFGVTPTTITIRRNAGDCLLTISKADYEDYNLAIEQGVNPQYWYNMVFTPLIPAAIYITVAAEGDQKVFGFGILGLAVMAFGTDFYTGAVHQHKPNKINAVLKAKK
jgi:hypothetical protein